MRLSKSVVETEAAADVGEFIGEMSMPALFRSDDDVDSFVIVIVDEGADDVDIDFCLWLDDMCFFKMS